MVAVALQGLLVEPIRQVFAEIPQGQLWTPEWLEIAVSGSKRPQWFYPKSPEHTVADGCPSFLCFTDTPSISAYTVRVRTGDACGAGTDTGAALRPLLLSPSL